MKKTAIAIMLIAIMCVSIFTALLPKAKADDNAQSSNSNSDQNSWPMFQHDPSHTGYLLSDVTAANQSQWQFKTQNQIWGAPVIAYGAVFVGSLDDNVYAVNSSTGNKIWNYATGAPGDVIESSPAVDNSVVYVGSSNGNIYALNASTGSEIWSYQTGEAIDSSPTVASGIIYVGSYDGIMYALNSTTGNKIWGYDTTPLTTYASPTSPAVDNGFVYFGGFNDNLYALNASNGKSLWNFTSGGWVYTPAVDSGVVYFGSDDSHVYALNATTGIELWNYQAKGPVLSSPAFANGIVYAGSEDGNVYALNAKSGSVIWSYQTTGNAILDSPAVVSGAVYIGSTENLYVLNATSGNELRVYQIANPTSAAFANGNLYVGSSDGNLYSFCSYGSLTSLNLSSNSASAGSSVICIVKVSGANPTGTITWKTSSGSGTFSSDITTLNSGTSSTTYIDANPGKVLITAIYSGDTNNVPSNQTVSLELLNASLPTQISVVQSGTLNSDIAAFNGTLINVDVRIGEAYSVWGYVVYLDWTPGVLKLLKVTEGPYLDQAGNTFFLVGLINNTAGTIEGGVGDALGRIAAASGSGVLFTLEFQAIGIGNANITIDPLNTIIAPSSGDGDQGISSIAFQVVNASVYVVARSSLQWTAIDFFNNGKVDASDFFFWMDAYIQYNANGVYTAACDLNHDGKIDNVDFFLFMSYYIAYGESLTGHTN